MSVVTWLLSMALSITSAQNVNIEQLPIDASELSQALLCQNGEMGVIDPMTESYLGSFDDSELRITSNAGFFKGSINAADLFVYSEIRNAEALSYRVRFDATYIAGLDVCIIDIFLENNGRQLVKESAYVFPFDNEYGSKDSLIIMNGFKYYRSELFTGTGARENPTFSIADAHNYSSTFLTLEDSFIGLSHDTNGPQLLTEPEESGIVCSVISISDAIIGVDRVVGFAYEHVFVPVLNSRSPIDFAFFMAKMNRMKSNFEHNCDAETPYQKNLNNLIYTERQGRCYIYDQNEYSDWRFSFFGNLANHGCRVVAVYNMLVDCNRGAYVDLPTLIALFEALNADTLFGCFGVNMIPNDYVLSLAFYLDGLAAEAALSLPDYVYAGFHELGAAFGSEIANTAFGIVGFVGAIATAAAALIALGVVFASSALLVYYFTAYKHDVSFIVELYIGSQHSQTTMDYHHFIENLSYSCQGIVCFWNDYDSDDETIDYFGGAHFVYIQNSFSDGRLHCYNLRITDNRDSLDNAGVIINEWAIPHKCLGANSGYEASIKMVSSYVFY